jgi:hypothetical protein
MAPNTTLGVIFEKSGLNRNSRPSLAAGSVKECTAKIIRIRNSSGINMFDIFSIPFSTPLTSIT